MKSKNIVIFLGALILLLVGIFSLSDNILSPYVPISEVKKRPNKFVQVMGQLKKDVSIIETGNKFTFVMIDESGETLNVTHEGIKPMNFEHSTEVVTSGKYDRKNDVFFSKRILTKCPSKYKKEL